ncbi:extracellular solute-binding protein [Egicoccus sp. AB-alg6-2]|uniref:extracellular solute-binding protein n=1 Tax=Egicoccus sp. AB-alg6-2 TaxID=3242692 RepID=UPI00359E57F3
MARRSRFLSLIFAIAVLGAACGSDDGDGTAAPDDNDVIDSGDDGNGGETDGETTDGDAAAGDVSGDLFAFGFGYETGDQIAQVRVDRFRELYPDVNLEFSESGFDEQGFLSALASDDPPDLVNIPRNEIGTYIARGVLAPLDECIAQHDVDTSVYYDGAINQVTVDGTVYAFPEFFNSRVWILNNAAFEDAGLDPETVDLSDWEALAEVNEQLTRNEGGRLERIGLDPKLPEFLPLWAWANGAPMISEDGLEANLDDPGVIEALELTVPFHEPAGGRTTFLDFRDTWDFFGGDNQYAADQLGGMPMEQWYLNVLAGSSPDAEVTVRPFEGPDGQPITWADGNSWAVTASAQNPEAACTFAKTMTEADTWIEAAQARADTRAEEGAPNTGVYTGNREADDVIFSEIVDLSDMPSFEQAVQTVVENQENAFGLPPSPASAAFKAAWEDAVNAVLTGADPASAMATAQQEAQAAIDAAR